jgi:curli production assembly/transport component CsgF
MRVCYLGNLPKFPGVRHPQVKASGEGFLRPRYAAAVLVVSLLNPQPGLTTETFSFRLPSFGGNPQTSAYYLTLLENQKRQQEETVELTSVEKFRADIERRLLSTLASDVVSQIFGDGAAESGSFTAGGLTVSFETVNGEVIVAITDGITTTVVTVPGL